MIEIPGTLILDGRPVGHWRERSYLIHLAGFEVPLSFIQLRTLAILALQRDIADGWVEPGELQLPGDTSRIYVKTLSWRLRFNLERSSDARHNLSLRNRIWEWKPTEVHTTGRFRRLTIEPDKIFILKYFAEFARENCDLEALLEAKRLRTPEVFLEAVPSL